MANRISKSIRTLVATSLLFAPLYLSPIHASDAIPEEIASGIDKETTANVDSKHTTDPLRGGSIIRMPGRRATA